jgi:hypothetical protein
MRRRESKEPGKKREERKRASTDFTDGSEGLKNDDSDKTVRSGGGFRIPVNVDVDVNEAGQSADCADFADFQKNTIL